MADREVTEFDLRADEFKRRDVKPEDYEFRDDGKIVRKDRWENGIHSIRNIVGPHAREFEIADVVKAAERAKAAQGALESLHGQLQAERARIQSLIDTYDRDEANASRNGFLEGLQSALDLLTGAAVDHDYQLSIPSQGVQP